MAVAIAIAIGLVATPASASGNGRYDLLRLLEAKIAQVKETSKLPVLLPHFLPVKGRAVKAYPAAKRTTEGWQLSLSSKRRCAGPGTACFIAQFNAQGHASVPGRPNLKLSTGDPALYLAASCGGACAPAELLFTHGGVLYTWQVKGSLPRAKTVLAQLAAEAIRAGPR